MLDHARHLVVESLDFLLDSFTADSRPVQPGSILTPGLPPPSPSFRLRTASGSRSLAPSPETTLLWRFTASDLRAYHPGSILFPFLR